MSATAWRFILFGILGMFGEVVFTSLQSIFKTRRLRLQGFSFLWMFPIYGLLAFCFLPLYHLVDHLSWVLRGIIYMIGIYAIEYISGTVLTALTGGHIWRYEDRFNYKGQITLLHAPVWFAMGLVVERYFGAVDQVARFLSVTF